MKVGQKGVEFRLIKIGEQLSGHAIHISGLIGQQSEIVEELAGAVEAMHEAAGGLSTTASEGQSAVDRHSEVTKELIEVLRNGGSDGSEPKTPSSPPGGDGSTPIAEDPPKRQGLFQKWFGGRQ